ncbi:hypothetical protein C1Y63_04675 [Corynebacterium sp. 13CS0277]|uniref:hypothetical protein n=1 Tax=Corynebacterium sp. 13CS0277 TaxID=2071994 RepID=UPI000D0350B0|nr:hypothetical protein [Corynebacterium sp. 13CS0277]PRQ11706.1 hypothetical protein C1Y63_04675 [Corynebacterium sp. 13CS0277]
MVGTPILDFTGEYIYQQVKTQPWYRAHANTVTTIAGFLVTSVAWLASQEWAQNDTRIQTAVWAVGFLATIVGVRRTPNGWSASQLAKVNEARAGFIDSGHGCTNTTHQPHTGETAAPAPAAPEPQAPAATVDPDPALDASLAALVDTYNSRRGQ